ncbi:MAG: hypothetical protein OXC48_10130 [Endozoicomonadaceae bacterium]|nr:hypothetical protein [Endozoicomonadaceae bacterium]
MNPLAGLSDICDKPEYPDQKEKTQSKQQVTIKKIMPEPENAAIEGKHIAKRKAFKWPFYGDPTVWDNEFERAVLEALSLINDGILESTALIGHFEKKRHEIAVKRKNKDSVQFGLRRDDPLHFSKFNNARSYYTSLYLTGAYGYALERALTMPYDADHYINKRGPAGKYWAEHFYPFSSVLRYGLVQGKIKEQKIPLTQNVFAFWIKDKDAERFFGDDEEEDYALTANGPVSGIWLHPDRDIIPVCIAHINEMIEKCLHGDLTFIPRIHWWYVHLAPTWRGSGGIAEMLTNTLCRLHGVDLPPWKDGVAPSVEVLLEPNEEKFCLNYHQLFENNQQELKTLFTAQD